MPEKGLAEKRPSLTKMHEIQDRGYQWMKFAREGVGRKKAKSDKDIQIDICILRWVLSVDKIVMDIFLI